MPAAIALLRAWGGQPAGTRLAWSERRPGYWLPSGHGCVLPVVARELWGEVFTYDRAASDR